MLRLSSEISIGEYQFKGVHKVEIESSYDTLTDTCTISFPRKLEWKGKALATGQTPLLQRGNIALVKLGYDDENVQVFHGKVRDISAEIPVKIRCEDFMYDLKKGAFTKSYKSVNLQALLTDMGVQNFEVTSERALNDFRISKATPAKVLEYLRKKYFVRSFYRDGILYVGQAIVSKLSVNHIVRMNRNVISHSLEYRTEEDIKIQVKGIIVKKNNEKIEVKEGDADGEIRTFHYYNQSESEVRKSLIEELDKLKYTGYRGSFLTFGKPIIRHGDTVQIVDLFFPEREVENVYVKKVTTSFGVGGFRQNIELEGKA